MTSNLHKWAAAALAVLNLAGCAMVGYGECFSRCGGNAPTSYGAPTDPTRGALWNAAAFDETEKYAIFGFVSLERIGEPPGADKVNAHAYVPNVTARQAQGSTWFSTTFGSDYVDPVTLMPTEGRIPARAPLMPPGIYKLTAQASVVEKATLPGRYYPFRSPPQSSTIVVEAGKWTVLNNSHVEVDESTRPMTITIRITQAGKDSLPGMRKSGGASFSPDFVIADPLPAPALPTPSARTVAP